MTPATNHRPLNEKPKVSDYGGSVAKHCGLETLDEIIGDHAPAADGEHLKEFCSQIFRHLSRVDQRRCAHAYLEALLATPGKKSIQRLARTVSASPAAAQSLRQFVNASPWSWEPAMHELAAWAEGHGPVNAWSIGRAFLPKCGERSVGVHRHYDPFSNRTLNCQVGYGAFLNIGAAYIPVAWELSLPGPWNDSPKLRQRSRVPDTERYRPPWAHVLGLVDTLAVRRKPAPIVADLDDEQDVGLLVDGLTQRGHTFVIAVPRNMPVTVDERLGTHRMRRAATQLASLGGPLKTLALATRGGGRRLAHILSVPVHLQGTKSGAAPDRPYQLFTEMRADNRPGPVWLTNLPHQGLPIAVNLASHAAGPAVAVTAMAQWFGLLDFEGRSFPGWHHHMCLVSSAYAYRRLGRSSGQKLHVPTPCRETTPAPCRIR
ncbi:hypothetical protein M2158_007813 [Streptomyces sp. SAI-144]|uniref:IS701 family transposase n=1 Tax=Streptomyces sp. SAI-144 TaxID=2940544 RepID=UPI0024760183|nr:transposase [Streptomyces sp. SAI-144]MDH6439272.1 hypothetical protein [Streptomyces sp. SAI-144]